MPNPVLPPSHTPSAPPPTHANSQAQKPLSLALPSLFSAVPLSVLPRPKNNWSAARHLATPAALQPDLHCGLSILALLRRHGTFLIFPSLSSPTPLHPYPLVSSCIPNSIKSPLPPNPCLASRHRDSTRVSVTRPPMHLTPAPPQAAVHAHRVSFLQSCPWRCMDNTCKLCMHETCHPRGCLATRFANAGFFRTLIAPYAPAPEPPSPPSWRGSNCLRQIFCLPCSFLLHWTLATVVSRPPPPRSSTGIRGSLLDETTNTTRTRFCCKTMILSSHPLTARSCRITPMRSLRVPLHNNHHHCSTLVKQG